MTAYLELTTCRTLGYGEGPIPWTAINTYCKVNRITGDQRDDLFYHVRNLDSEYLKWRASELEKK
jgi:hypothetical protein